MKTTTIRQSVLFDHVTPQEVYSVLMDSVKHSAATGAKAKISSRIGGKISAWNGYITGENVLLEKGRKIVQKWVTTEWPEDAEPSLLTIEVFKTKKGTKLLLTQENVPVEQAEGYDAGWDDFYWTPMREYFSMKRLR